MATEENQPQCADEDELHRWFGLSYASYLTLPRSLLQEMPLEWKNRFAAMLRELNETYPRWDGGEYAVQLRSDEGKFKTDPLAEYRHPNTEAIEKARG